MATTVYAADDTDAPVRIWTTRDEIAFFDYLFEFKRPQFHEQAAFVKAGRRVYGPGVDLPTLRAHIDELEFRDGRVGW